MGIKFAIVVCLYSLSFQAFGLPGCDLPTKWQNVSENAQLAVLSVGGDELSSEVPDSPEGDCTPIVATPYDESRANQPLGLLLGLGTVPHLCAAAAERNNFRCFQTARTNHVFNPKNGREGSDLSTTDCFACK